MIEHEKLIKLMINDWLISCKEVWYVKRGGKLIWKKNQMHRW